MGKPEENRNNYDINKYDRPSVPVDRVVLTIKTIEHTPHELPKRELQILMVQRAGWPYKNCWAIPGGFSNKNETLETAGERELQEETGIENVYYNFLKPYSEPGRDPRGWIISMAYYSLVNSDELHPVGADDAKQAVWLPVNEVLEMATGLEDWDVKNIGKLAFDHKEIIHDALRKVRRDVRETLVIRNFLPDEFTISELKQAIKIVDPDFNDEYRGNFARKIIERGIIEPTGKTHNKYSKRQTATFRFTGHVPKLSQWE